MATAKTTKVFVGNLSFKTSADELKKAFETIGKVSNANIITRGSRSLGYGFVEFEAEADANKAVSEMNKRKIDDRDINVEIAKPRDDSKPMGGSGGRGRTSGFRSGRRGYGRGRYGVRGGYRRGPMGGRYNRYRGRPMRRPVSTEGRALSTTTLFVANLPYSLDDDGLSKIFSGLSIKQSKVVRRPNGKSKGFGFVEFSSEEDQRKGLNLEKKSVEGRDLVIKVALTEDTGATGGSSTPTAPVTTATVSATASVTPKPSNSSPVAKTPANKK